MTIKNTSLVFLLLLFTGSQLLSQAYSDSPYSPRTSYGIFLGGGANLHFGSYSDIPDIDDCCPEWTSGIGANINAGAFFALPITSDLEFLIMAQYNTLSGSFEETETKTMSLLTNNGIEPTQGEFIHSHDATINAFGGNLGLAYRLTDQLRINSSIRVSTLLSPTSDINERLTNNSSLVYPENGTQTRVLLEEEAITGVNSLDVALQLGASYDIPVSNSYEWFLVPMVNYSIGFLPVVEDLDWSIHTFNAGVGIRYSPREVVPPAKPVAPPPPPPPPPLPLPPPPPIQPTLDATIKAVSVDENGNESDISLIKVEENYQIRTHPLLNFVFFDDNSPKIANRYIEISDSEKPSFSFREFFDVKTMDVYYNILNIVGKRMAFYPQANIELIGTNSGVGAEKNNTTLSKLRAESVRDFLVNEWKVSPNRITIKSVNLPDNPTNTKTQDGIEENRRVEMYSNLPQIFEPIIIRDTVRTSNPPYMRFKPTVNAEVGISEWKIITSQNDVDLKTFSGKGEPPAQIDWFAAQEDEQEFIPKMDEPLDYRMEIVDNDGKVLVSKKQTLPVDQITIQKKIFAGESDKIFNKFSMIGFPYNSDEIQGRNMDMLKSVNRAIEDNSEIFVSGYSDRLGDDDYNLRLAQRRANAVGKALKVPAANISALGESRLLYDNEMPEGRFYSRTVLIDVVTVIE
jgi:outer membrane protein OmpA-like peptidoglycan-associated protein